MSNVIQFPGTTATRSPLPAREIEETQEVDYSLELERLLAEIVRIEASVDQLHATCRNLVLWKQQ